MNKVKATADGAQRTRGQKLVESLRGRGDFQMTTDDVVALMRGPTADNERKLGALAVSAAFRRTSTRRFPAQYWTHSKAARLRIDALNLDLRAD